MITVYGHRLMGKTDIVPGRFHVATKFYHIDYVPLIPASSHLIFEQTGKTYRGIRIPLCGKSILSAYLKAASVIMMVVGAILTLLEVLDPRFGRSSNAVDVVAPVGVLVAGIALFVCLTWLKPFTHASAARARKLCKAAGLTDEQTEQLLPDMTDGFAVIPSQSRSAVMAALPVESV